MSKHRQSSIQELVRLDLVHREQVGRARYGTSLYPFNGRSSLVDAYEEALDLACYLRQMIEELVTVPPETTTNSTSMPPEWRAARSHDASECGWYCTHEPLDSNG